MASVGGLPPSVTLIFIIILVLFPILFQLPLSCYAVGSQRSLLAVAEGKRRQQPQQKSSKASQIPNCSEIAKQSLCKSNPKCRWCRSNLLDDMCAYKLQAWRLPSQVFTCD